MVAAEPAPVGNEASPAPARYLIVDAADDPKWAGAADEFFGQPLAAIVPEDGEEFVIVRPYAGEKLPRTVEEVQEYRAALITGSGKSAYEDTEWIQDIAEFVRTVYKQEKTRLFAACFGHQIVAHALGGKVARGDHFMLGPEVVRPRHELWLKSLGTASRVILEAHGDFVQEPPVGAEVLAGSDTAAIESMAIRAKSDESKVLIWTLQAHAELTAKSMLENILPFVGKRIPDGGKVSGEKLRSFDPSDAYDVMRAMKYFMAKGWETSA